VAVVLAAGAAYGYSSLQPKVYEAKATLIVGQALSGVSPDYDQLMVSQRLSATYAAVATKRPILKQVIDELTLGVTVDDLAKRVRADAALESTLLTITTQDTDPDVAAAIANGLADQLVNASASIEGQESEFQASIQESLAATQSEIAVTQAAAEKLLAVKNRTVRQEATLQTLQDRLASLRATYVELLSYTSGGASNLLSVVEPAVAPNSPASPKTALNTLLAAVIGLLIALGLVAVLEYLDDRVKTREELEELAGVSILGQVEKMRGGREMYRLATLLNPRSVAAEAYRTLRTNIEFASVDSPISTLLVTSSIPGEGKTVTAANLAVAFAQAGRRVLLVDADLRKPGVHSVFNLPNTNGLTSMLRSDAATLEATAQRTEQANLRILTTGPLPPNPAELLGSQRMRLVLERLRGGGDLLVFDSPPLRAVTDAAILSSFLDATLLVVDAGVSRRGSLRLGMEALSKAGANVLGAFLNRSRDRVQAGYMDYGAEPEATRADKVPTAQGQSGVGA
jgi:non-specific protein-tyrosine kinase